jgi:hypothetical protein
LIEWSLHQSVRDDADDRSPGLRFAGIENPDLMTECALIAPIFSRKTRVHDCDRLLRIVVVDGEIASF